MLKKPDIQLLQAYLAGKCTPGEARAVEQWLFQSPENIGMLEHLAKPDMASLAGFDREKVKEDLLKKIDADLHGHISATAKRQESGDPAVNITRLKTVPFANKTAVNRLTWWARAAAAVLIIAAAGMVVWFQGGADSPPEFVYHEITSPVRTITTLTLSDGTNVELNSGSTLRYPASFQNDERVVYLLEGEAFFSVAKDMGRTFKVHSGRLTTTVLGTDFNVNYMPGLDIVDIALVEGKVSVEAEGRDNLVSRVTLEPDQWISYSGSDTAMTIQEGVRKKILWRDGILEFDNKSLSEVAASLENWYGVEIVIEDPSATGMKVTGTFKDASLERILESLKFMGGLEYQIEMNKDNDIDKVIFIHNE